MAASIARMAILFTADTSGMQRGFRTAESSVVSFSGVVSRAQGIIAGMMAGAGAAGIVGWGVKLAAEAEQAKVAFDVMLGSADKAATMLGEIKSFALETPFGQSDLRQSAQVLLQFGVAGENIMPTLEMLGDVSMGNADKLRLLSLAFGQMSSAGKLMGQDLLQMINAGFNPLQEISKKTGISMADLRKQMEAGNISTAMVTEAFRSATSEGGRFFQMMDQQSGTLIGRWAKLKEQAEDLARSFGEFLAPSVSKLLDVGTGLLEWMKGLDVEGVKFAATLTGGVLAFSAVVMIVPKVVAAFTALVSAYRALTTAQAISQAFAGPKGWATLAAGALAAGAAVYGISTLFDDLNEKQAKSVAGAKEAATEATAITEKASEAFSGLASSDSGSPKFDFFKQQIDAATKGLDDLKRRGESLTESLRTPMEVFKDSVGDANEMVQQGAISWETYSRAVEKAQQDLKSASVAADSFNEAKTTGAADRFTSSGFSAVNQARADMQRSLEVQQAALAEQKRIATLTAELVTISKRQKPVEFKTVERL